MPGFAPSAGLASAFGFGAGADEVAIFAAATDAFSRANLNAGVAETLARYADVAAAALGFDPVRVKTLAFAISAALTGLGLLGWRQRRSAVAALQRDLHLTRRS